jgi:phosphoglycerate kinase
MIPTLRDVSFEGKRVLMRAEFNVPLKNGEVQDDLRIREALPTIKKILLEGASQLVLMAHLGRPDGQPKQEFSLKPVAVRLQELLGEPVTFLPDCIDAAPPAGARVVLLENLRFHKEEEKNDAAFAGKLAAHGDVYVDDAFGCLHRAHASVEAVARLFKERCVGLLIEKELKNLDFSQVQHPFVVLLGCAKISDKIELLDNLLQKADTLLLGGAIVFDFLKAEGYEVGKSLYEPEKVALAQKLLEYYQDKIVLPKDVVISEELEGTEIFTVGVDKIPPGMKGLDIGDESVEEFIDVLDRAATVFWNGPVGVFETPPFDTATKELAEHLAQSKARVVVGGGDTTAAVDKLGLAKSFTHVSTGGGAALEYIAGHKLPGLEVFGK